MSKNGRMILFTIIICLSFVSCNWSTNTANSNSSQHLTASDNILSNQSGYYILGEKYDLDTAYIEELQNSSGNHTDFYNITEKYAVKWKEKMEQYYNSLIAGLDTHGKELLEANQKDWQSFMASKDKFNQEIVDRDTGTSAIVNISADKIIQYRKRAIELLTLCKELPIDCTNIN